MELADYLSLEVNYLSVLLAAVVYFLIGALWYSPQLFGHHWMKHEGIHPDHHEPYVPGIGSYIGEFILDLLMAFVLALFIALADINSWGQGMLVALWAWIGFVAAPSLSALLWSRKSYKSFLINAGFVLVGLLAMGAIIGFMQL